VDGTVVPEATVGGAAGSVVLLACIVGAGVDDPNRAVVVALVVSAMVVGMAVAVADVHAAEMSGTLVAVAVHHIAVCAWAAAVAAAVLLAVMVALVAAVVAVVPLKDMS
jgi:hypothetical protein